MTARPRKIVHEYISVPRCFNRCGTVTFVMNRHSGEYSIIQTRRLLRLSKVALKTRACAVAQAVRIDGHMRSLQSLDPSRTLRHEGARQRCVSRRMLPVHRVWRTACSRRSVRARFGRTRRRMPTGPPTTSPDSAARASGDGSNISRQKQWQDSQQFGQSIIHSTLFVLQ
jgi:hypothetical protein